ncbi:MAG: hypothetical protein ACR2JB_03155 [Bryobacteraceae bacterium]
MNLAGAEIILNMPREDGSKQIRGFVEILNEELLERTARWLMENHSSMPVIQINSMTATRVKGKRGSEGKRKVR